MQAFTSTRNRRHGARVRNAGAEHLAGRPRFAGARGSLGSMTFDRLHHVQLAMPRGQEAVARAFFVEVLGMTEIQKPPVLAARGERGTEPATWSCTSASRTHLCLRRRRTQDSR